MFRVGDEVALDFVLDGTPTAEVERPDGTTSPLTPVPVGDGVRVSFTADQAGRHVVVCATATKTQVEVVNVHSARPRAIASLAELKEHMNMTDTQHDDELREHLEAATLVVEQHTGQVIARRTVSGERHRVGRRRPLVLKQVPVVSVESVTARSGSTPPLDEIEVIAETGEVRPTECGAELYGDIVVDYVAGHPEVPQNFILATLIIAAHLYELQHPPAPGIAGYGIQGAVDDSLSSSSRGFAIPNKALELLGGRPPSIA